MSEEKKKALELIIYEDGCFKLHEFKNDKTVEGKTNPAAVLGSFLLMALGSVGSK